MREFKLTRRFDLYLKDIQYAISKIKRYTSEMNFESFKSSEIVIDAVLKNLIVIGEAASQLPENFKAEHSDIPWIFIKDFRNVAVHKYHKINLAIVWDIVQNKLDELHEQVEKILEV